MFSSVSLPSRLASLILAVALAACAQTPPASQPAEPAPALPAAGAATPPPASAPATPATAPRAATAACDGPPAIDIGFAPEGGAEELVLKAIGSATASLRLATFVFTSPEVAQALVAAHQRGVDVRVAVDHKGNTGPASARVLRQLAQAGIPLRTVAAYPILHDKFIVVDGCSTQLGSFNYTRSAGRRNSENVMVLWRDKDVARHYAGHWDSRWSQGKAYRTGRGK